MSENKIEIKVYVNTGINIPPQQYDYEGGFADLTQCSDCKRTGLHYDQHPTECCPNCGGDVTDIGAGKWDADKKSWIRRG